MRRNGSAPDEPGRTLFVFEPPLLKLQRSEFPTKNHSPGEYTTRHACGTTRGVPRIPRSPRQRFCCEYVLRSPARITMTRADERESGRHHFFATGGVGSDDGNLASAALGTDPESISPRDTSCAANTV